MTNQLNHVSGGLDSDEGLSATTDGELLPIKDRIDVAVTVLDYLLGMERHHHEHEWETPLARTVHALEIARCRKDLVAHITLLAADPAGAASEEAAAVPAHQAPAGFLPVPEDAQERRYFDLATETYGGDVRANINLTLRQYAKQFPASGSLACTLNIIANEVLKLNRPVPAAVANTDKATQP